mmetsp:Transcript_9110/g.22310  ORF Transcript_9110/g.22310 Transcript_9110/m.22310 type:complete len:112 (+) Transcript_9110:218-553(+)
MGGCGPRQLQLRAVGDRDDPARDRLRLGKNQEVAKRPSYSVGSLHLAFIFSERAAALAHAVSMISFSPPHNIKARARPAPPAACCAPSSSSHLFAIAFLRPTSVECISFSV